MAQNILYIASFQPLWGDDKAPVAKIGITTTLADARIRQLNSTKMPAKVELEAAFDFTKAAISAVDAEFIFRRSVGNVVNGEWHAVLDETLEEFVQRIAEAIDRMGASQAATGDKELEGKEQIRAQKISYIKAFFSSQLPKFQDAGITDYYFTAGDKGSLIVRTPIGSLSAAARKSKQVSVTYRRYKGVEVPEEFESGWKSRGEHLQKLMDVDKFVALAQKLRVSG